MELAFIFLGGIPPRGIRFKTPGAVHHARWLAKAIYCLKIFLFKDQFHLQPRELNGLRHICIFIVLFYVKSWFTAPSAIKAPKHDLELLQNLIKYKKINADVSNAASLKLSGHLWYLSEDLSALSLFDDTVSLQTKEKIIHALKEREGTDIVPKRVSIKPSDLELWLEKDISDFVTKKSLFLFRQFDMPCDFMDVNPEFWNEDQSFNKCREVLYHLRVVNDVAERGVALIEEYNSLLTKDEEQRQYILQVVKYHREQFPDCQKNTLSQFLQSKKT